MDGVTRRVTFPSGGETLTGALFTPPDPADGRLPAVVVAGGQTCVKEQMAGRYAGRLAPRGYAALAFDFRGFGESTGEPRDYESPSRKVEDLRSAVTFLAGQRDLDSGRLAALGIGVGAGYVAVASLLEGKSAKEALRWLERRLSDAIYRCLLADQHLQPRPVGCGRCDAAKGGHRRCHRTALTRVLNVAPARTRCSSGRAP
jgi:fermentation-respiration switch protein FrsA (DUF1100 family)